MKICLIGNNLTSLILAYILSKRNFYVEICYLNSTKSNYKTRTLGITDFNLNYLKRYFHKISKVTNPIKDIKVLIQNGKINNEIDFNKNSKTLFNMVKYQELISYIKSKTLRNRYISFKKLKKNSQFFSLINSKKFELVINCEKSNIFTKKFLKNRISKNYFNKAFTTIIEHKKINNNLATQVFTKYGPIAYLPLSNKLTSIVFSFEVKDKTISHKKVLGLIKKFNTKYEIISSEKIESFDLNLKIPKYYYNKNILFFGDSIHSIHPLAGQGFNMTIRDIIKFTELIDERFNLGMQIDKTIYKDFEKLTKSYNSIFSFGVDLIHEFFRFNKNFVPKKISENIFSYLNRNKNLKELGIKFANEGNI